MTKTTIPKIKTGKYASGNPFWRVTYSQDGKQVIKKFKTEREANDLEDEKSLIYGEVDFKCVTRPASISIESAPGTLLASFVR